MSETAESSGVLCRRAIAPSTVQGVKGVVIHKVNPGRAKSGVGIAQLVRVAARDGITPDRASLACAHCPGSGKAKIMDEALTKWVDVGGKGVAGPERSR